MVVNITTSSVDGMRYHLIKCWFDAAAHLFFGRMELHL